MLILTFPFEYTYFPCLQKQKRFLIKSYQLSLESSIGKVRKGLN